MAFSLTSGHFEYCMMPYKLYMLIFFRCLIYQQYPDILHWPNQACWTHVNCLVQAPQTPTLCQGREVKISYAQSGISGLHHWTRECLSPWIPHRAGQSAFLGVQTYKCRFIRSFSIVSSSLTTWKMEAMIWSGWHLQSQDQRTFTSAPILKHPDLNKSFKWRPMPQKWVTGLCSNRALGKDPGLIP